MKRAIIIILLILAIGGGASAYYLTHKSQPLSVTTAPITRADVVDAVASTGTLQPVISVTVGAQVSGNIAWLGADFNSIVKKNQVIAKLDPTLFESQVAQAKAQVAQATASLQNARAQLVKDQANVTYSQVTYKRTVELNQKGLATQDQLDQTKAAADQGAALVELDKSSIQQAQANVDQAKAQLNTSQTNLEHSIITSPIDGIVTQRSVDVGQTVQSSMTAPQLFVIAQDLTQRHAGRERQLPRRCVPRHRLPGDRRADSPESDRRQQRDDVRDDRQRAERRPPPQARHDDQPEDPGLEAE